MQTHSPSRHFRFSSKNPTLPDVRHSTDVTHAAVLVKRQGKCIHCRYKYMCAKIENPDVDPVFWGMVRQPQHKCVGCGFYLVGMTFILNLTQMMMTNCMRNH